MRFIFRRKNKDPVLVLQTKLQIRPTKRGKIHRSQTGGSYDNRMERRGMKNYKDTLPRKVYLDDRTPLCQHLDASTGNSCDRHATVENFISEGEKTDRIHLILLCDKHADLRNKNI